MSRALVRASLPALAACALKPRALADGVLRARRDVTRHIQAWLQDLLPTESPAERPNSLPSKQLLLRVADAVLQREQALARQRSRTCGPLPVVADDDLLISGAGADATTADAQLRSALASGAELDAPGLRRASLSSDARVFLRAVPRTAKMLRRQAILQSMAQSLEAGDAEEEGVMVQEGAQAQL